MKETLLLYGLLRGSIDNLSEVARKLGITVNTVWRWAKEYETQGILSKDSKYKISSTVDALRFSVSYLLRNSSSIEEVLGKLYKILDEGWAVTGSYALYYYDLFYLLPPKPPILSIVVQDNGLKERLEKLLAPITKAFDTSLAVITREKIALENEPPYPLENLLVTPPRDALLDSLEMAWREVEPPFLAVQAFYMYSPRIEEYLELIEKAVEYRYTGALKLMNLASGLLKELSPSRKWLNIYLVTRTALGKTVQPSKVNPRILDDIHFAITETVLTNGLYTEIVSKFTKNIVKEWKGEEYALTRPVPVS